MWEICILALYPSSAFAHVERGQATGFITGLQHPWSGLDHVLAMIAVGPWGAQLGNPALWLLPVTFPMVMSMGAMMGLLGIPLPGIEIGIALSAILLGAMVLAEARPRLIIAALLVGFFAIFHGHAHGTELPAGQSGLLCSMGFVIATGCLHGLGITVGLITAGLQVNSPCGRRSVYRRHGRDFSLESTCVEENSKHEYRNTKLFGIYLFGISNLFRISSFGFRISQAISFAALILVANPSLAFAHLVTTGMGPVYDGIGHLLLTPEDLVPVLALALYAGLRGAASGRRTMFLLPIAWFVGGIAGSAVNVIPSFPIPAISFLVLGGLVAADLCMPSAAVMVLPIILGLVHGFLNGSALKEGAGTLGLLGIMTMLFILVALASAFVISLKKPWTRVAVRVAGSWIFASGLLLLGWLIRVAK